MPLNIITADQRLNGPRKINMVIFGPSGVGKTTLARTLPDAGARCLFLDAESGTLAIDEEVVLPDGTVLPPFMGDTIKVRDEALRLGVTPWELARAFACLLTGPDPAAGPQSPYSAGAFESYKAAIGDPAMFERYDTVFVDSITVAGRWCFAWSKRQPEAFSEKTGKPDTRGAYGLHGQEMVTWLTQLQHIPGKSVIIVGILNVLRDPDIPGRISYVPQIDGGKTGNELPGIFDQVMTMGLFTHDATTNTVALDCEKGKLRALVCTSGSGYPVPAKDRSGRLSALEPPNLAHIMTKTTAKAPRREAIVTTTPAQIAQAAGTEWSADGQPAAA